MAVGSFVPVLAPAAPVAGLPVLPLAPPAELPGLEPALAAGDPPALDPAAPPSAAGAPSEPQAASASMPAPITTAQRERTTDVGGLIERARTDFVNPQDTWSKHMLSN